MLEILLAQSVSAQVMAAPAEISPEARIMIAPVDERRAEVGLGPHSEYLAKFAGGPQCAA